MAKIALEQTGSSGRRVLAQSVVALFMTVAATVLAPQTSYSADARSPDTGPQSAAEAPRMRWVDQQKAARNNASTRWSRQQERGAAKTSSHGNTPRGQGTGSAPYRTPAVTGEPQNNPRVVMSGQVVDGRGKVVPGYDFKAERDDKGDLTVSWRDQKTGTWQNGAKDLRIKPTYFNETDKIGGEFKTQAGRSYKYTAGAAPVPMSATATHDEAQESRGGKKFAKGPSSVSKPPNPVHTVQKNLDDCLDDTKPPRPDIHHNNHDRDITVKVIKHDVNVDIDRNVNVDRDVTINRNININRPINISRNIDIDRVITISPRVINIDVKHLGEICNFEVVKHPVHRHIFVVRATKIVNDVTIQRNFVFKEGNLQGPDARLFRPAFRQASVFIGTPGFSGAAPERNVSPPPTPRSVDEVAGPLVDTQPAAGAKPRGRPGVSQPTQSADVPDDICVIWKASFDKHYNAIVNETISDAAFRSVTLLESACKVQKLDEIKNRLPEKHASVEPERTYAMQRPIRNGAAAVKPVEPKLDSVAYELMRSSRPVQMLTREEIRVINEGRDVSKLASIKKWGVAPAEIPADKLPPMRGFGGGEVVELSSRRPQLLAPTASVAVPKVA